MTSNPMVGRVQTSGIERRGRLAARNRKGITLVELMVVVAIIAVISSILLANYSHAKASSEWTASEANMKQIATALELYNGDNQAYPAGNAAAVDATLFGGNGNNYFNATTNSPGPSGGAYTYTQHAAAGNQAASYTILDPADYDEIVNLPQANATGVGTGKNCSPTNLCHHLGYLSTTGLYAY